MNWPALAPSQTEQLSRLSKKHRIPAVHTWPETCEEFPLKPSAKINMELLTLNMKQLRQLTELLTRHCHVKGHLLNSELVNHTTYERCHNSKETHWHLLNDYEAVGIKLTTT
jgi:hypothetical protein